MTESVDSANQVAHIIAKAIGAHGVWRTRLNEAVERGYSDVPSEKVYLPDACDLGKWIYSDGLNAFHETEAYKNIEALHREFHKCAGDVVLCVEEGRIDDAFELMERDQPFSRASNALISALRNFGTSLENQALEDASFGIFSFSSDSTFGLKDHPR